MSELLCDHTTIFSKTMTTEEKCNKLASICGENQEIFNFFKIYLCDIDENLYFTIPLIILILVILFKFICTAVEEYVAPAIVYLSEYLNLTESLAGVTLLAFANGAGDVLTAIVASDSKEGISYNVGALYGAGLFVLTLVVALTIKNSPKKIIVSKSLIFRDIGFYLLATVITVIFAITGKLTWWTSVMMLLLYLCLVIFVVIQDCLEKSKIHTKEEIETEIHEIEDNLSVNEDVEKNNLLKNLLNKKKDGNLDILRAAITKVYHDILKHKKEARKSEEGCIIKFIDIIDFPFDWLRKLTIPPCEEDHYNHLYTILWPFLGITFILYNFITTPWPIYLYALPVSCVISFLFWKFKPEEKKIPKYFIIIDLIAILCGVLWTKIACGLLVDLLSFVGVLTNLSSTYLGLTVIAVGNALPDGLTTIAIAKKGQAVMGLTGGIVGQLFGLLVGFGVSMLKKTLNEGEQVFDLFNGDKISENLLDLIVIGFAFGTMLFIFFYSIFNNFHFDMKMSYSLIVIYGIFLLSTTIYAFLLALNVI